MFSSVGSAPILTNKFVSKQCFLLMHSNNFSENHGFYAPQLFQDCSKCIKGAAPVFWTSWASPSLNLISQQRKIHAIEKVSDRRELSYAYTQLMRGLELLLSAYVYFFKSVHSLKERELNQCSFGV